MTLSDYALPPFAHVVYPDSDGERGADNTLQWEWIATLKSGFDALFASHHDVFVAGDLLWYPVEGQSETRLAPDVLVVFGRPKGYRGSYLQWRENGVVPQVVFGILSPGNRAGEMQRKFAFYEQYGVEEYYVYDPDRFRLSGWLRSEDDHLEPIAQINGFVSPRAGVRFVADGEHDLELYAPDGARFLSYVQLSQARDHERTDREEAERLLARAERDKEQAEHRLVQAELERDAERQMREKLEARLRALGIDPNSE